MKIIEAIFDLGLFIAFFILLLCSFFAVLPDNPLWIGIYAHFKLQYGIAFGILALFLGLRKKKMGFRLALLGAVFNLTPVLGTLVPYPKDGKTASKATYKLVTFNVLARNKQYQKAIDFLSVEQPDFLIMTEYTPAWHEALSEFRMAYPYTKALPRYGFNGSIILSKHPIVASRTLWFGPFDVPALSAEIQTDHGSFELVAIHPPSPPNVRDVAYRNVYMDSLTNYAKQRLETGKLLMIGGDFNNTPFHYRFKRFRQQTGLRDSRQGFGNQASFPKPLGWAGIPLDHILMSEGIRIKSRKIGPDLGSDHLPVICSFSFE